MKKVKRILCSILAIILFFTFIPEQIYFAEDFVGTTGQGVDVGGWSGADGTTTRTIMIPPFTVKGITSYCCQLPLDYPVNYSYPAPYTTDNYVYKGVALLGYPADILGLKAKYGLSNLQAEQYTQYALWKLTGGTADRRHPYVDEIITRLNAGDYGTYSNITFKIKNPNITMIRLADFQESNIIETAGSPGSFTFPSNSQVWSVDINGNRKDTFSVGESFKIRAILSYDGIYNFSIKATLKDPTAIIYKGNGVVQDLLSFEWREKILEETLSTEFKAYGNLSIIKVDDNGNKLANVRFGLYSDSEATKLVKEGTTNADGILYLNDIDVGTYYVRELSVPEGYNFSNEVKSITIESEKTATLDWINIIVKGTAKMVKVDAVDGKALPGAKFKITCISGFEKDKTWEKVSDENGVVLLENFQYGTYTIEEIATIDGYVIQPEKLSFIIDENNETINLKMTNDRVIGNVQLVKIDTETGLPLANADFRIICDEGFSKGATYDLKSDSDGIIKAKFEYGKYRILEVKAPTGYVLNKEPIPFDVNENGQQINLQMSNNRITSEVQLIKVDTLTNQPLADADFTITCKAGFSKGETYNLKSDSNGIIKATLKFGKYSIVEVKAPTGYVLNTTPIDFAITENGQNIELKMTNERIKGNIQLVKVDTSTGKPLSNAQFIITCLDGFAEGQTFNLTSSTRGIITAELDYGKYQIDEIKAPTGYVLNPNPIQFEVTENGQLIKVEMKNDRIKSNIELIKIDSQTGKPLANAQFRITCLEGFSKGKTYDLVSDENGIIRQELEYGKYVINEVKTPTGYVMINEPINFDITENGQRVELNMSNSRIKGTLKIHKIDANNKRPLSNVKFKVECLEGFWAGKSLEFNTDKDGNVVVEEVQYGKYKITEILTVDGYVLNSEPYLFEIKEDGQIIELTIENKIRTGNVILKKKDIETKEPLQGIVFELYKGDQLIGPYTTDENGEIRVDNLSFGQYYFKEVETIAGYVLDNESNWTFGILEDQDEIIIEAANRKIKSKVEFSKIDSYDGRIIAGARMLCRGLDLGNSHINFEFISELNPTIFELPYGNYEIIELEAPEGYVLNESPFNVNVSINNERIAASIDNSRIYYGK